MKALLATAPRQPDHFARAAFATFVAASGAGQGRNALSNLQRLYPADTRAAAVLNRAAVDPAKTSVNGWAAELTQTEFRAFLGNIEPLSAAAKLIAMGVPAQLNSVEAKYPTRSGALTQVPWVAESGAVPVGARALAALTLGPSRRVALISVLSQELATRADGEATLTQILREDAAVTLDLAYFGDQAGSTSAHAGLLYGVAPLTASSAGGLEAMREDLASLASAVATDGSGQVAFVMSTGRAAILPILAPDLRATVLPSPSVPASRVIAVDPVSLIHATDPAPDVTASKYATVHLDDDPDMIGTAGSPAVVASPTVSVFQTNQIALRVIAEMAWSARRAGAVGFIDGVDWS